MVLNMHPESAQRESRGQVIIFSAVLLALVVLSAVVVANGSVLATMDEAEGIERSVPDSLSTVDHSEHMVQSVLVRTNRDAPNQFSDAFSQQADNFAQNAEYNGEIIEMSIEQRVEGHRVYGEYDPTVGSHNEGVVVAGLDDDAAGSIVVDTDKGTLPPNKSHAFRIEYGNNTIKLYDSGTASNEEVTVHINSDRGDDSYKITNPTGRIPIDLGVGKVGGINISEYGMDASGAVTVERSDYKTNRVYWTGEFVTTGTASPEVSNFDDTPDALYGVGYKIQIQSQRSSIQTTRFVTHGPTPPQN